MTEPTLTKIRIQAGVWHGILSGAQTEPRLCVTHMGQHLPGATLTKAQEDGAWCVRVPIPTEAIADGVQTLMIADADTGVALAHISLLAGEALDDDMRADLDLLRAELDMLKKAFRHHCVETG